MTDTQTCDWCEAPATQSWVFLGWRERACDECAAKWGPSHFPPIRDAEAAL